MFNGSPTHFSSDASPSKETTAGTISGPVPRLASEVLVAGLSSRTGARTCCFWSLLWKRSKRTAALHSYKPKSGVIAGRLQQSRLFCCAQCTTLTTMLPALLWDDLVTFVKINISTYGPTIPNAGYWNEIQNEKVNGVSCNRRNHQDRGKFVEKFEHLGVYNWSRRGNCILACTTQMTSNGAD